MAIDSFISCCYPCLCVFIGLIILYKVLDYVYRLPRLGDLQTKYILVTGCDTGFGHEFAVKLDRLGSHVFAGCLTEKGEDSLSKRCSSRLRAFRLDVTNDQTIKEAVTLVQGRLPTGQGLWAVVNNAGILGKYGPVEWCSRNDYMKAADVNLYGLIEVTLAFLPLVKRARGRIVNLTSIAGRFSFGNLTPYSVSKHGAEVFSDGLRRQMAPFGVGVHIIEPGFHKTNITSVHNMTSWCQSSWESISMELQKEYGEDFYEQMKVQHIGGAVQDLCAEDINPVLDALEHAALARYPRARYVVGSDARWIWLSVQGLPEWLGDRLLAFLNKADPVPRACR